MTNFSDSTVIIPTTLTPSYHPPYSAKRYMGKYLLDGPPPEHTFTEYLYYTHSTFGFASSSRIPTPVILHFKTNLNLKFMILCLFYPIYFYSQR